MSFSLGLNCFDSGLKEKEGYIVIQGMAFVVGVFPADAHTISGITAPLDDLS
ncbi:hypothetical protein [Synechococcus sp. MIT S1220]|uniref:hypothetical protein n=1 Tax=Synechococcus sp. MIT S1220 TaxID=3082549 RepID=UPI0039AF789C